MPKWILPAVVAVAAVFTVLAYLLGPSTPVKKKAAQKPAELQVTVKRVGDGPRVSGYSAAGAEYLTVSGLADPVLQETVNRALHAPLEQAQARYTRRYKKQGVEGVEMNQGLTVEIGLKGPRILSAAMDVSDPVFPHGAAFKFPAGITVDLTTGQVFTPRQLFKVGLARLGELVRRPTHPIEGACRFVPTSALVFTADNVLVGWRGEIPQCADIRWVAVPYAEAQAFLRPEILELVNTR
ncbi:hypothetical protein ACIBH1_30655 [Nonomuraea sp. NPDC050663]|uniref:hypothetical protein n=1 Tax=Nonomuraea sp. NPDC050663 TaxID=3364370 RepID=UPI0037A3BF43